jgi:hypothetical protein
MIFKQNVGKCRHYLGLGVVARVEIYFKTMIVLEPLIF